MISDPKLASFPQTHQSVTKQTTLKLSPHCAISKYTDEYIIQNYDRFMLNMKNVLITKEDILKIVKTCKKELKKANITYDVSDINLFIEAMTDNSYMSKYNSCENNLKFLIKNVNSKQLVPMSENDIKTKNIVPLQSKCYERLEFLGDSIIRLATCEYLYKRYPNENEGFLSKLKIKIECGDSLSKLSKKIGLDKFLLISNHIELNNARTEHEIKILGDVFEAFIGALFLDSNKNYDLCKIFIIKLIETKMDLSEMLYNETNYKDMLMQHFHKMKWTTPVYDTIDTIENTNKKIFVMCVKNNQNEIIGIGEGTSKKKGEQLAAKQGLKYCNVIENVDDSEFSIESIFSIVSKTNVTSNMET